MAKSKNASLCVEWLSQIDGLEDEDEITAFRDWLRWGARNQDECDGAVVKGWVVEDGDGGVARIH